MGLSWGTRHSDSVSSHGAPWNRIGQVGTGVEVAVAVGIGVRVGVGGKPVAVGVRVGAGGGLPRQAAANTSKTVRVIPMRFIAPLLSHSTTPGKPPPRRG